VNSLPSSSKPATVSVSERRVLDHIYSRQSGHISPRALEALLARGLVVNADGNLHLTPSGLRALQSAA
jgi:hypothetical protein